MLQTSSYLFGQFFPLFCPMLQDFIHDMQKLAIPEKVAGMEAYLKDQFKVLGVNSPERKSLYPTYFNAWKKLSKAEQEQIAIDLWNQPFREFKYVSIDWMRRAGLFKQQGSIALFERCILEDSWWDTVDGLASNLVGGYFLKFPQERDAWIEKWDNGDNLWLHRTTLIFQLKYKDKTDLDLLDYLIKRHKDSKEFFIRKAIGWSLREVAKRNPLWVLEILDTVELSGLSQREARKGIPK
ncbi:MAG: DNA alkylation repair protein [Bacteroidetes bacterium]|nr:MAG: DNA alkylation repair protein [Bacteroidota bacterium]